MQKVNLTNQQIQQAAKSGLEFFNDKELKVPVGFAISGDLLILQQTLMSLAMGQTVLVQAPEQESQKPPTGLKAVAEDPHR